MEQAIGDSHRVFRSRVDASGRIVLPRELRDRWHLSTGDGLLLVEDGPSVRLETPEVALQEARAYFRSLVPKGVSVVDELLAERREEAARE